MPLSFDCINVKGAMNACSCGYYPDRKRCRCTLSEIRQYMFPVRNRLISGLSERVVIVETAEKSGSLITADFALEQGREIYVFPGRYEDVLSRGTNRLIYQGAGVILSPEEFVSDLLSIKDTALSFTGGTVKGKTGIEVRVVEEAYTSGTSYLDGEMPKANFYNKSRRIHRGLFCSNAGVYINADVNAAYQILKAGGINDLKIKDSEPVKKIKAA